MKKILYVLLVLFLSITALFASPIIDDQKIYYKVNGLTSQDIRNDLNVSSPTIQEKHYDGKTNWYISWTYQWDHNLGRQTCKVTIANVKILIKTYLPQWESESVSNDTALKTKWDTYLANLTTHEEGHVNNGEKAASEIEKAFLDTPEQADCIALKDQLDKTAKQIIQEHKEWDVNYDEKTHHGVTQGAVFP